MATESRDELLERVLRDLLTAEADYRSAMHIYVNRPLHRTRIRAESRWWHTKETAKAILAVDQHAHTQSGKQPSAADTSEL